MLISYCLYKGYEYTVPGLIPADKTALEVKITSTPPEKRKWGEFIESNRIQEPHFKQS